MGNFFHTQTPDPNYVILLVGWPGAGKSRLGNFLTKENFFNVTTGHITGTVAPQCAISKDMAVVDTQPLGLKRPNDKVIGIGPFFETIFQFTNPFLSKYLPFLKTDMALAKEGFDAIILVIPSCNRFTADKEELLNQLPDCIWQYIIIAFTRAGELGDTEEEQKRNIDDAIKDHSCPTNFKNLMVDKIKYQEPINECNGDEEPLYRYTFFELSNTDEEYREACVKKLQRRIQIIKTKTGGRFSQETLRENDWTFL